MELGTKFVEALKQRYQSEMMEAEVHIELYTTKLTAIGEHSDLMSDLDLWVTKYTDAKGKLDTLFMLYNVDLVKG